MEIQDDVGRQQQLQLQEQNFQMWSWNLSLQKLKRPQN